MQTVRVYPAFRLIVWAVLALLLGKMPFALAETPDFLRGKTLRFIVGYAPGGGYDAYARLLLPHLEARLGATIIVENRPGAGGFNALRAMLRDPADGLQIMLLNGEAAVLSQLVNDSSLRFDLRKLAYLGRLSYENRTLVTAKGRGFDTIDGFLKSPKSVHFGAGDRIDTMGDPASIFCNALQLACKLVTGYQGAPDAELAMLRGEVDAIVTSESQTASFVKGGAVTAVTVLATHAPTLLPGVRPIFDLVPLSPERSKWLRFRAAIADFGRVVVTAGNTPADRISTLKTAIAAVATDSTVQAEGVRTNRPIAFAPAEESRRFLDSVFGALSENEKQAIRHLFLNAY